MVKRLINFTEQQYEYLRQRAFDDRENMSKIIRYLIEREMKKDTKDREVVQR